MSKSSSASRVFSGGCHCGAVRLAWRTARAPGDTAPRACDCSFCSKHGAAWVSDATGHVLVTCDPEEGLTRYRQGAELADFLLCGRCGVVVAVVLDEAGGAVGAVNASCLDAPEEFAPRVGISPQRLDAETKLTRWRTLWMPMTIEERPRCR